MAEKVQIKVWRGSPPHRLIESIQMLAPGDVDEYIRSQAERIAKNDAIKEVQTFQRSGSGSYDVMARMHRAKAAAEERLPYRINQLSRFKIKVDRIEDLGNDVLLITGEKM